MYHKSYDYIEYYDKATGAELTPDFNNKWNLPESGDLLSFNGGKTYRIVGVREAIAIREIKNTVVRILTNRQ